MTTSSGTNGPTFEILRLRDAEESTASKPDVSFLPDASESVTPS